MILGTGIDVVEIERIRRLGERFGARFLTRVFTEEERLHAFRYRNPWPSLAARWAAKEAGMKALGLGMEEAGWRDFEVVRRPGEAPQLRLSGRAARRARLLGVRRAWLSLSHSRAYAVAHVVMTGDAQDAGGGWP